MLIADSAHGNVLDGNFVGTTASGNDAVPNGDDGLLITSDGGSNLVQANVFSGNVRNGIELAGNASGVTILPNIAGLNATGTAVLPNGGNGLLIDGSAHQKRHRRHAQRGDTAEHLLRQYGVRGSDHGIGVGQPRHPRLHRDEHRRRPPAWQQGGRCPARGRRLPQPDRRAASHAVQPHQRERGLGVTLGSGTFDNAVIHNYIGLDLSGRHLPNSGRPVIDARRLQRHQG